MALLGWPGGIYLFSELRDPFRIRRGEVLGLEGILCQMIQFNLAGTIGSFSSASGDILFMRKNEFPAVLDAPAIGQICGGLAQVHRVMQENFSGQRTIMGVRVPPSYWERLLLRA